MSLTQKYLHSILSYDRKTGIFRWILARKKIVVGAVAGTLDKDGYRIIKIDQKNYRAGRLAFFFVKGRWPKPEIDHRNLNKADDRWRNLREGSKNQNMRNTKVRADSSTGAKCVQVQNGGSYLVRVTADGQRVSATFNNLIAAKRAHRAIAKNLHGEFARVV